MAKVIQAFKGVPDGDSLVRNYAVGDTVTGDLAVVAVREGWAEEGGEGAEGESGGSEVGEGGTDHGFERDGEGRIVVPEDWKGLHHMKKIALARAISGDDVETKAAAEAIIDAELTSRQAG